MQRSFLLILSLSISSILFSQNETKSRDYFIVDSDTSFFETLNFNRAWGAKGLSRIICTEINGNQDTLTGADIPKIETFYINDITWDRVPAYPMKNSDAFKFMNRIIEGKVILYYLKMTISSPEMTSTDISSFVKMPDGSFYNVEKKKQLKNFVIPFLEGCEEFKNSYEGKYKDTTEEFTKIVNLYNSSCEE